MNYDVIRMFSLFDFEIDKKKMKRGMCGGFAAHRRDLG
jgi:hypothetical protein